MFTGRVLLVSLLLALAGCQRETPIEERPGFALAQQNGCFNCHEIDMESYCPKWRDVAEKYRGDGGAEQRLTDKIANGGSGVWGEMTMPPHPQIGEEDRRTLARFVLSL